MALAAKENTGLFIKTKDVDHPVWHIRIINKNLLAKWMEILNHSIGGAV